VENLFSKVTRTMLRDIHVASKQEVNATRVIFRWRHKMDEIDSPG
jgi:hypothetical protein